MIAVKETSVCRENKVNRRIEIIAVQKQCHSSTIETQLIRNADELLGVGVGVEMRKTWSKLAAGKEYWWKLSVKTEYLLCDDSIQAKEWRVPRKMTTVTEVERNLPKTSTTKYVNCKDLEYSLISRSPVAQASAVAITSTVEAVERSTDSDKVSLLLLFLLFSFLFFLFQYQRAFPSYL